MARPHGLAFGPDDNLYVGDATTSDGPSSQVLRFQGPGGANPGQFIDAFVPSTLGTPNVLITGNSLAFDNVGNLYVSDTAGDAVHVYDPDGNQLDDFIRINKHLQESGRTTKGELIMGMPGESKESFLQGVEQMIDAKVSFVCIYTLMLLTGTEFKNPQYLKEHGIKGKYRVVPLNFGQYEGSKVLDCEEVGIESNDMSFDDYLYLRGFALLTETLHNGRPFEELFRYALSLGVGRMGLLRRLYDNVPRAPQEVQNLVKMFLDETRDELWDSEEELIAHYQNEEEYGRLHRGEVGGNLIYKYKTLGIGLTVGSWIDYITDTLHEIIGEKVDTTDQPRAKEQLGLLAEFCQSKLAGLLAPDSNLGSRFLNSKYDITGWLQDDEGVSIDDYSRDDSIDYEFYYTDDQMAARDAGSVYVEFGDFLCCFSHFGSPCSGVGVWVGTLIQVARVLFDVR